MRDASARPELVRELACVLVGEWAGCRSASRALEGDHEAVGLPHGGSQVSVAEPAEANDAVEVADVAVVEDEVAGGGVVADVVDVGVGTRGSAVQGEWPGQLRDLLDVVEVAEAQRQRQLVDAGRGRWRCRRAAR